MALMNDEFGARFRARSRGRAYRREPRAHPRAICRAGNTPASSGRSSARSLVLEPPMFSRRAPRLDLLSFSREQEYEADTLGLRYIIAAGYDPGGAARMLAALTRENALEARVLGRTNRQDSRMGEHAPVERKPACSGRLLKRSATGRLGRGSRNRDQFLSELEGVYVDDDPAQGVIDGPIFHAPGPPDPVQRAAGLFDVERRRCGDDFRICWEGAISTGAVRSQSVDRLRLSDADARSMSDRRTRRRSGP